MNYVKAMLSILLLTSLQACADGNEDAKIENSESAIVFMYHRFGESRYPSTNIRLEQFEYHLNYLQNHDYKVWPLSKIVEYLRKGEPLPPKTVALTMDDAYVSIFTEAYPRLKKRKFPFTVFVNTNPIDVESKNYMSWEQMRKMRKNGAEYGNHSLSHPFLLAQNGESETAWKNRITREVLGAQERLQKELGEETNEEVKLFSYPFGEYDAQTAVLISRLGYTGVSQTSGPIGGDSDLLALPRFAMAEAFADPEGFIAKLFSLPLPISSVSPWEPVVNKENPPLLRIKLKRPLKGFKCYLSGGEEVPFDWISQTEVEIQAKEALHPPRDRYTCTAPAKDNRYYWYSHLWIIESR